jgi:hypothetical protein
MGHQGDQGIGAHVARAGVAVLLNAGRAWATQIFDTGAAPGADPAGGAAMMPEARALTAGIAESVRTLVGCGRADRAVELLATLGKHSEALAIAERLGRSAKHAHGRDEIEGAREYWQQQHGVDAAARAREVAADRSADPGAMVDAFLTAGAPGAAARVIETQLAATAGAGAGARGGPRHNSGTDWVARARDVAALLETAAHPTAAARLLERTGAEGDLARAVGLYLGAAAFSDAARCRRALGDDGKAVVMAPGPADRRDTAAPRAPCNPVAQLTGRGAAMGLVTGAVDGAVAPSLQTIQLVWAEHCAAMAEFADAARHYSAARDTSFLLPWATARAGEVGRALDMVLGGAILRLVCRRGFFFFIHFFNFHYHAHFISPHQSRGCAGFPREAAD